MKKEMLIIFALFIMLFGATDVLADTRELAAKSVGCSLEGKKCVDSKFADSVGDYVTITQSCSKTSKYGSMAVVRGIPKYDSGDAKWLMYPAQKCAKGKTVSERRNIRLYAERNNIPAHANRFGVRMYGNHCDNQKTGCYASAIARNSN